MVKIEVIVGPGIASVDTAYCPTGKVVLSGGIIVNGSNISAIRTIYSGPNRDADANKQGWTAGFVNLGDNNRKGVIYAYCASL